MIFKRLKHSIKKETKDTPKGSKQKIETNR